MASPQRVQRHPHYQAT